MDLAVLEQRVRLVQQTLDDAMQCHKEATKTYYREKVALDLNSIPRPHTPQRRQIG